MVEDPAQSKSWQKADVRILGQILAAQNIEFALPDTRHVAEFFAETLSIIPGVKASCICLEDVTIQKGVGPSEACQECPACLQGTAHCPRAQDAAMQFIQVSSLTHRFGFLGFQIADGEAFEVYKPFVINLTNFMALSLENRQQRGQLQTARTELEQRVAERTSDLLAANTQLQAEIESRRQLEDALKEREWHAQSLLQLSRCLERAETFSEVMACAREEVQKILGYPYVSFYILSEDQRYFRALFDEGVSSPLTSTGDMAEFYIPGDRMLEKLVKDQEFLIVEDAQMDERTQKDLAAMLRNRTVVNIPIKLFDNRLGWVVTGTRMAEGVRAPSESEQSYLRSLASRVAVTLDRIHLNSERKRSEEKYRTLVEKAPYGIFLASPDGRYVDVNESGCQMLGFSRAEILSMSMRDLVAPGDQVKMPLRFDELQAGMDIISERCLLTKSGAPVLVEISGKVLDNGNYLGIVRDITRLKRDENIRLARMRLLEFAQAHTLDEFLTATLDEIEALTGSSIGFYHLLEDDGKTITLQTWSTHTLTSMCTAEGKGTHYPVAEAGVWADCVNRRAPVIHNDYAALPNRKGMPEGHAPVVRELLVPVFRGPEIKSIAAVGNKATDYTEQDVEIATYLADLSWDIAERKRVEEEIRRLNQDLEKRVAERTIELENVNKELEAFAYSVSHDLRAPLRHIDGFMDLLQNRTGSTLDEKSQHYMTVISGSARQMGELIDDLLSFSRMGRSEMSKTRIDLGALVREVIDEFKPEVEGRSIQWQIADLPDLTGDRAMLRMVFTNLISNALKFTRSRQPAMIEIGWQSGDAPETVVFIRDNGVGFDMRYADNLFGVFQRLHREDEFEGTGIGLANVRRIINRHGGRTWAEGELDRGATFYVALPRQD